jgi:predicted RNA-binding protein associated with RNAse of E/G family
MPAVNPGGSLEVLKLDLDGRERWRYPAKVISYFIEGVLIEAFFNRPDDLPFHGIIFHPGDRFLEMYYTDRRYNIFEVYYRDTAALKCWYCNASRPAVIRPGLIEYVDLALDLLILPGQKPLLLDEDEFEALEIDPDERRETLAEMRELEERFQHSGEISLAEGRI